MVARLVLAEDIDLIRPVSDHPRESGWLPVKNVWQSVRSWWPLGAAVAVAISAIIVLPQFATQERHTPLGLSVDIKPEGWLVSWNPRATAIRTARRGTLYMFSGNKNKTIALGPAELSRGVYQHPDASGDATFRLEIDERTGHVSAESFRLVHRQP